MQVIETERLILRYFDPSDAPFILELLNEPGWKRFIGDRGITTIDGARNYIETGPMKSYRNHNFGLYAIEMKDDEALVGMCGLIKRDTLEDVDIGFALLSKFEGQGIAREAAVATLDHARNDLGLDRVVAITTLDNERSGRLLEMIGMKYESDITLSDDEAPLRLYSIDFDQPR